MDFTPERGTEDFRVESLLVFPNLWRVRESIMGRGRNIDVDVGLASGRSASHSTSYSQRTSVTDNTRAAARCSKAECQKRPLFLLEMKRGRFIQRLPVLLFSSCVSGWIQKIG